MQHTLDMRRLHDSGLSELAPNGPRLWRLRFGSSVLDAHLHDVGRWGVAYCLLLNGRLTCSERHQSGDEAAEAAAGRRSVYEADGWQIEAVPG